ncbi:hypothetical protein D3C75_1244940 [compost metagenome]
MQAALDLTGGDDRGILVQDVGFGLGLVSSGDFHQVWLLERIPDVVEVLDPLARRRAHQHFVQLAETWINLR